MGAGLEDEKGAPMKACTTCRQEEVVAPGRSTATLERGDTTVVIRNVPSEVCGNCGEKYFDAQTTDRLLQIAEAAVRAGAQVEILDYRAAA